MISTESPPSRMEQDAQRRRALAKVYELLIGLVEETEKLKVSSSNIDEIELSAEEPTLV